MHNCFIPFAVEPDSSLIPEKLNNPFDTNTPEICQLAAAQLQAFIAENQSAWLHNFGLDTEKESIAKGKMFGVLVVKNKEDKLGYLCTFSGKLADEPHPAVFVPSLFDIATDNNFISKGMIEITAIGNKIKALEENTDADLLKEIEALKEERKTKSSLLQQQLFESYNFLNKDGVVKNVCAIFETTPNKIPPSGAGECAAPKLLHYAFAHGMQPLAIAEFWWGKSSNSGDKQHGQFYPACTDKCKPILEYMLGAE
jgi:tRNA pseudouridine32 synthase/23S rRNA pseudouridine746 synthase